MASLLEVDGLSASYGRMGLALDRVSLTVEAGSIVAILGANGAGKTTLIRAISGLLKLHGGAVASGRTLLDGQDVTRLSPDRIVRLGVAQAPEGRMVFKTLSVEDNLAVGAASLPRARRGERMDAIYHLFPRLAERRGQAAGLMSGGEQQMLAVGRALAAAPRLMLIDELSLGLAPLIVKAIYERLGEVVATFGTAILVVEQSARIALRYCDRAYVLEGGRVALSGAAGDLSSNERMRDLYLGAAAGH
ncbi:MAG: ABC transporter ATP-binding protein [Hyphomicrobiales bacterium]|nr:ABC transporter ATP-binding protein [Hyphomicrobiales bacterium]